jgi:hypothetical protein
MEVPMSGILFGLFLYLKMSLPFFPFLKMAVGIGICVVALFVCLVKKIKMILQIYRRSK